MIARIVHYHTLRRNRLPHRLAWTMSGLRFRSDKLIEWASVAIVVACCLFLLSESANSAATATDNRAAAKINQQAGEIAELRKIVAACLSDSTGKPVVIGGEWFLCGITSIGTFK